MTVRVALGLAGAVLAPALGLALPAPAEAAAPPAEVRVLTRDQAELIRTGRVRVAVTARGAVRLRLIATTPKPVPGPKARVVTGARDVRMRAGSRRTVSLPLRSRSRRVFETCGAVLVSARAAVIRGTPAHMRAGRRLGPDEERCRAAPGAFAVGAARRSTNPAAGERLCLGGYGPCPNGKGRTMTGIKDDLYARAMAVSAERGDLILVTTSNVGFFAAYKSEGLGIYELRQEVARRTGVPAGSVLVQADHSHSAPDTIGIWGGVPPSYVRRLQDAAVDAAVAAWRARRPARLYAGRADGPGVTSSYSAPPNVGTDDEFRLLWAERAGDGRRIATYSNYSPHATVLEGSNTQASGDWPEWAAQLAEAEHGGVGLAGVGTLGREDFGAADEADARSRLRRMMAAATAAGREVPAAGGVAVRTVFLREPLAQPVLALNRLPEGSVDAGGYDLSIDRADRAPWLDAGTIGTYAGAARIGDLFLGFSPGEPFPQVQFYLREQGGVSGPRLHFHLGATGDFLGYMVRPASDYPQVAAEGGGYLLGCPEEEVLRQTGIPYDPACPDHWTLMVSPTIGTHVACTIQDAGEALGFEVRTRDPECA
ncbi:MAG TPA: hypothetical protein VF715_10660, partial [Thermoleophilaceae bacterium]